MEPEMNADLSAEASAKADEDEEGGVHHRDTEDTEKASEGR